MVAHTVRLALGLLAALAMTLACAAPMADEVTGGPVLDGLFEQLKHAPDPATAHAIDQRIWAIWMSPPDPVLASRMNEVLTARRMGDPVEAIVLLNRLIEDYPNYAEAWNQRATMYYAIGKIGRAHV